jgi:hypothetical protein
VLFPQKRSAFFLIVVLPKAVEVESQEDTMETAKALVNFLKALPRQEREAVLARLVADDEIAEDLTDSLISEFHRQESRHALSHKAADEKED